MVACHHQLKGHEFDQAPGDGEGQGSLADCSPWGRKEVDMTEWLNNKNNNRDGLHPLLKWACLRTHPGPHCQGKNFLWQVEAGQGLWSQSPCPGSVQGSGERRGAFLLGHSSLPRQG